MRKVLLVAAVLCMVSVAVAAQTPVPPYYQTPEIDPGMAMGSVAALAGGLMVLRHYRRRK